MNPKNPKPGDSIAPLLVTPKEAAMMLAMSERTLWALSKKNEIIPVRNGRMVRYDVADLSKWVELHKGTVGGGSHDKGVYCWEI